LKSCSSLLSSFQVAKQQSCTAAATIIISVIAINRGGKELNEAEDQVKRQERTTLYEETKGPKTSPAAGQSHLIIIT
jgi:hypothetical protein